MCPLSDAVRLAAWTRLQPGQFALPYTTLLGAFPNAARWGKLEADLLAANPGADGAALILAACQEAEGHGFLARLALAIVKCEADLNGRSAEEGGQLLDTLQVGGEMQAITDAARGLMGWRVIPGMLRAAQACAIVLRDGQQIGTAFLVRPDLVLTAAHVVLETGKDAKGRPVWREQLRSGLSFSFRAKPGDPEQKRDEVPAAANGLVAVAVPHGVPPRQLNGSLQQPADTALDFALVRLSRQVTHVVEVDVDTPLDPKQGRLCFVFGFTGGDDLQWDTQTVDKVDPLSGRLLHRANTTPGMSGGCYVGHEGTVVALHEGSIEVLADRPEPGARGGGKLFDNRGVCLSAIRAMQKKGGSDPLDSRPKSPGVELADPALVRAMYRAGLQLVGPERAEGWSALVQAMLGLVAPAGDGVAFPAFHPWFSRKEVETWIDSRNSAERLCYVYGDEGAGKSFGVEILRAKLTNPNADLVALGGTRTSAWCWHEAIAPIIQKAEPDGRTEAGAIRYDDVPAIVTRLGVAGGAARTLQTPLFVAIDFESAAEGMRFGQSPWLTFIEALAREPWARVMLIGLTEDERDSVDAILDTIGLAPVLIRLAHLGEPELKQYLKELLRSRGLPLAPEALRERIGLLWPMSEALRRERPAVQTIAAALTAMMFERVIRD